ncbi:MAG: hypothetical protein WC581_10840 [Thermodesulfovibrionales bacterium]
MTEKEKRLIPRRLEQIVLWAFIFVPVFVICQIEFRFPWSLVNGTDDRQLMHSTVISKDLILDTVLFIMLLFSCMFICTSELNLMPTDTCKVALADTTGCAVTSGCLCVICPISPEGQRPRKLNFALLNLPLNFL